MVELWVQRFGFNEKLSAMIRVRCTTSNKRLIGATSDSSNRVTKMSLRYGFSGYLAKRP